MYLPIMYGFPDDCQEMDNPFQDRHVKPFAEMGCRFTNLIRQTTAHLYGICRVMNSHAACSYRFYLLTAYASVPYST